MPRRELNDRFCRTVKPGEGQAEHFDTITPGLALRVSPGGAKTWFVHFTRPDGKRARMKLGSFPDLPLGGPKGARQKARDARGQVGEGCDPLAEKRARASAMTVADLIESYATRHASTRRSGAEIARILRANLSSIAGIKLADLHRRDLTRCLDAVRDRGAPIAANRVFANTRAMLRWAHARGDLDANIVAAMRQPAPTPAPRDRVLSANEIKTMWAALADADGMREGTKRIVRLCLLTGQRVGEIAGMTRDELDLEARVWTIPGARCKNGREHKLPVSAQAAAVIREQLDAVAALAKRKQRETPPFVFPAPGARAAITANAVAHALRDGRIEAEGVTTVLGVAPFTAHDLRRTMATHMEEIGISPFVVGHVLNHLSVTKATITSAVYARYDYAKEKREALALWADRLDAIVKGGAEVVPLRKGLSS